MTYFVMVGALFLITELCELIFFRDCGLWLETGWGIKKKKSPCYSGCPANIGNSVLEKDEFLYRAESNPQDCTKNFTLYSLTDHLNILGSIQPCGN